MEDLRPKEKLKAYWQTVLAEHDRSLREFTEDIKGISKYAKDKVRTIQDRRRQRQLMPTAIDLVAEANQAAGSEIVSHFQRHWGAIHRETKSTSQKLSEMQGNMHTVHHYVTQSHQIISNACEEMRELPDMVRSVEQMRTKVTAIGDLLKVVEEGLAEYAQATERLETERKKQSAIIQQTKHQENLEAEVRKWEELLQEEQALTKDLQDQVERKALQDRQKGFENMFEQQMAEYRESGMVERPILADNAARERAMSEKSVDDVRIEDTIGQEELKDFLSDVENDPEPTSPSPDQSAEEDR